MGRLVDGGITLRIEHDLGDTGPIPQVNKHDGPMIATALYPAVQDDMLANLRLP
jgi:hypothetical protein